MKMKPENNLELFGYNGRAGAQRHSATSMAAAEDRTPHSRQAGLVLDFIKAKGRSGATTDEVRRALLAEKLIHENSVMSARIRELEMAGLIVKTATLRETRANKMANVYVTQEIFALGGFLRDEVKPAPAKVAPSAMNKKTISFKFMGRIKRVRVDSFDWGYCGQSGEWGWMVYGLDLDSNRSDEFPVVEMYPVKGGV